MRVSSAGSSAVRVSAIIVAGGRGTRVDRAPDAQPKQYLKIGDRSLIAHATQAFDTYAGIQTILSVIHVEDGAAYSTAIADLPDSDKRLAPVTGGSNRQSSVRAGLEALARMTVVPDIVLIHDAARPFVPSNLIADVIAAAMAHGAAIPGLPIADTLKKAATSGRIEATVPRANLWRAQTPQAFKFDLILTAHRKAMAEAREDFTDDAEIAEWAGHATHVVMGHEMTNKITTADDLVAARAKHHATQRLETRIGSGFDIHRFCDGDHVWLGGVKIPHTHKLEGHSDADVALHALTDALLGCIGDGDIGQHFPPSDPTWKGAASQLFLADAARRVAERGGRIVNVDITILAEAPKIGPHRPAMQTLIGGVLGLTADRIGIKATTMEGLGAIGRREGIAAMATATVELPAV